MANSQCMNMSSERDSQMTALYFQSFPKAPDSLKQVQFSDERPYKAIIVVIIVIIMIVAVIVIIVSLRLLSLLPWDHDATSM